MTLNAMRINEQAARMSKQLKFNQRKRVNQIALTLSLLAMSFGLSG
jgi:hypothetical protein